MPNLASIFCKKNLPSHRSYVLHNRRAPSQSNLPRTPPRTCSCNSNCTSGTPRSILHRVSHLDTDRSLPPAIQRLKSVTGRLSQVSLSRVTTEPEVSHLLAAVGRRGVHIGFLQGIAGRGACDDYTECQSYV